jgi:hypothetical protein
MQPTATRSRLAAEHLLTAFLIAAGAYYWVLGRKQQKALTSYRKVASDDPWALMHWSQKAPLVREGICRVLGDGIERSPEPAIVVVQGRAGAGRTSFIAGLVKDLANRRLIPVPVLAKRDGSFELEDLVKKTFCDYIDRELSSEREADEIWHRARSARDVVVLVDGLDDEAVDLLWRDGGARFKAALADLHKQNMAVVLATTKDLPLRDLPLRDDFEPLREDLDLFSREEAELYVNQALANGNSGAAIDALDTQHDPVDGFLIAPFYLDLIVRLLGAGVQLGDLPSHRDRWRAKVVETYVDAVREGRMGPMEGADDPDGPDPESRGRAAASVANRVAREIGGSTDDLTVPRKKFKQDERALNDAVELRLLWRGDERVGFAGDDLCSYFVAATADDPSALLAQVQCIAERKRPRRRGDRHALNALTFWHLRNRGGGQLEAFERLLSDLHEHRWTRPAIIATAVRIGSACRITDSTDRLAAAVHHCVDTVCSEEKRATGESWRARELIRLVRALGEWTDPAGHGALWKLATNRDIEVEWPAAKALAMAKGGPYKTLEGLIDETIEQAENRSTPAELSQPDDELGNQIASLAWILPALREVSSAAAGHLSRVATLCLQDDMSPLRGEMSLAQGLKFAIVNGRSRAENLGDVRSLLFERKDGLRFWHARLVLAHAWHVRDDADALERALDKLGSRESHPLVRRAIYLARVGLREARRSPDADDVTLTSYMWIHEREAVRWVEQGKAHVNQLAADAVLVSNMLYRLRTIDHEKADEVASDPSLPHCVRRRPDLQKSTARCVCPQGLCMHEADSFAVKATRAQFSECFCREQARLARRYGPPPWTRHLIDFRRKRRMIDFWDQQAQVARSSPTAVAED